MADPTNPKMPLTSQDVTAERAEQLRSLFPEAFSEGRLNVDKLKLLLGEAIDEGRERYGLTWSGKAEAIRALQVPSTGTLVPMRDQSVDFDNTDNLMIEGDNLEVLKLLQKAYHGKVKMIYIDPPYNTGKEFIYPDNFREGLQDYLRYSGQVDGEGLKLSSNSETSGRYHSKWLSMMYPRLFLARNLLTEDGVIFVSIDDHEVQNLRHLLDEVFGPENFIATVIWQKMYSPKNTAKHFSEDHDYILVYARSGETWRPELLPRTAEQDAAYKNPDNDSRGPWKSSDLSARNFYSRGTYPITCPSGRVVAGPPSGNYWRYSPEKFKELDADGRIWWGAGGDNTPSVKRFLSEVKQGRVPQTLWGYKEVGHNQLAKREMLKRITFASSESVFDTPKPTRLIEQMLRIGTRKAKNDIVLDFFAGSGSTGDAVMKLNAEDGGNRRYILVQLPEPTGAEDYATIADITKARLRSAGKAIGEEGDGKLQLGGSAASLDLGFQALRLAASNFKVWQSPSGDEEQIARQLELHADNIVPGTQPEAVLYELMLKAGINLTAPVEAQQLGGQDVYAVEGGLLLICLADPISVECIRAMIERRPHMVICLDHAFRGKDQLLTNTVLEMKSHGIEHFRTV